MLLGFAEYRYLTSVFDRPDFNVTIALVEAGRVKNYVVKDMSRFGRDYLKVGFYTEVMFPDMDVRFIALYDNVDSDKGADDLTPFRNIMNEILAQRRETQSQASGPLSKYCNLPDRMTQGLINTK